MGKDVKIINLVDFEATCWDELHVMSKKQEIIECGIVQYDLVNKQIIKSDGIIVKPTSNVEISDFCTSLTTLTQDYVYSNGITFYQLCNKLEKEYSSRKHVWLSWGMFDFNLIQNQANREKIRNPFNFRHINFKTVFSLFANHKEEMGMSKAVNASNLKFKGTQHRGVDDAKNMCYILTTLLEKYNLNLG